MKLSRTKLSLFFRVYEGYDRFIVIRPDGRMARMSAGGRGYFSGACYACPYILDGYDYWSIFPTPEAALKAMRKYEKETGLPEAEFIGVI